MSEYGLSKTKILSGWQCQKRLWLEVHDPDKAEISAATERAFEVGHTVGDVARQLFPDGELIDYDQSLHEALEVTRDRLSGSGPVTLFEATFRHEGVLIRADVLIRDELDRIRLIEVKASTGVKPVNFIDCAVQAWVLAGAGLHPTTVELAHVNNHFVYAGDDNYDGLLTFVDVTDKVAPMLEHVPSWVSANRDMLASDIPSIDIGPHCRNPYQCPFLTYCTPPRPEYPVSSLPGGGKVVWELSAAGIDDIRDIPAGRLTNETQRWVRRVTIDGRPDLNKAAAAALADLAWPRYFFDFETVSFAVPIWAGTRPYQALPFQWSCHVQAEDGSLDHREWLAPGSARPMRECAETLIGALGESGPIFVYTGYEAGRLRDLASMYPDLAPSLKRILARLFDLYPITRSNYYHPDMMGSWSIKSVLPTVAPDMDYGTLGEVQEGSAASDAFMELMDPDVNPDRRKQVRADLLRYCAHDTLALVRLASFLSGGA